MQVISNRLSLRTLVLGAVVCGALLPTVVLVCAGGYNLYYRMVEDRNAETVRLADFHANHLDQYVNTRIQSIGILASHLSSLQQLDPDAIRPFLARTRAGHPSLQRLAVVGANGAVIALEQSPNDREKGPVGLDDAQRGLFRLALQERRPTTGEDLVESQRLGKAIITIASPIIDPSSDTKGAVIATLDMTRGLRLITEFQLGTTGHAVATTRDGIVAATDDQTFVRQRADFSRLPIWQYVGKSNSGIIPTYIDERGYARLGGYATAKTLGWKVWVSARHAETEGLLWKELLEALPWVGIAVALAVVMAVLLLRLIVRPVESLRRAAEGIAAGDFDRRVLEEGPVELVRLSAAINIMTEAIQKLLREMRGAASNLTSATMEILAATKQQVSTTAEEATAVRETATTVAQLRQAAELAARKSRAVADLAQRVATTAEDGQRAVEESVRGSEAAKSRMESLAERILSFSEQAEAIAEINATVGDLAEQSNLLAVNAGIEAAKAGEAGKGFAVVAAEVKSLAERSKEATIQVRRIVSEIQKSAQATVMAAEQGVKAAETGTGMAQRSGTTIAELKENIIDASEAAQQIMAMSEQQHIGMDQIVAAMQNIEQASAQTVAATQQVEQASLELDQLSRSLTTIVTSVSTGQVGEAA